MTKREDESRRGSPAHQPASDTAGALQDELRREAAEHDTLGGDTATNRNLTGSSTWETLGAADGAPARESSESDPAAPAT